MVIQEADNRSAPGLELGRQDVLEEMLDHRWVEYDAGHTMWRVVHGNALLVALTFTNGMVLFALGVVGEYATRILVGVERRPPYLVRETIG